MPKYDLNEYKFALKIAKEYPELLQTLYSVRQNLKRHRHYFAIQALIDYIDKTTESMEHNLSYYTKVVEKKGKKDA